MKNRVIEIIEKKKLTPSRFADKIGVPRSTISHIISGRNKPSLELVSKIADSFPEINLDWLIKGKGSMLRTQISLFDDDFEAGNDEKTTEITPESVDTEQKPSVKTGYVNKVKNGTDEKSVNKDNDLEKSVTGLQKGKGDISKIIIVYSDDSFEVLKQR